MSDNNEGSIPFVASAAAVAESSAATKRSHEEMDSTDNQTLNSKSISNVDDDALFASGMDRLKAAKVELELANQHMKGIRQKIRSKGHYEPDSLLYLCDGEDNHILSHILNYLTIEDMGRCEVVCSILKKQAIQYWKELDKLYFANHPTLRSPSAKTSREAVIRYKVASRLAECVGDLKELIDKHTVVHDDDMRTYTTYHKRIRHHCRDCTLPDLNFNPFRPKTRDKYELFVRFCRTSDNELLAEGFVPFTRNQMQLRKLDFSNWPQFVELTRLIETAEGDSFANELNDNAVRACMSELTAVVIGIHKRTSKGSLSLVQSNFGRPDPSRYEKYLHNRGENGSCKTRGYMSEKSHVLETKRFEGECYTTHRNRHCDAKLRMVWDSRIDQDGGGNKVCLWALQCECNYQRREY